jgi:hypothetical protein
VVEVGKDLVVGALHVVTEGLVGVTSAFFGLVSHSISAIGNILNGLTKGVGALMEGVGLFGKALFEGFGEGLSLAAKTAINIAGGVADVTVGLVHTAGDMATAAMKGIGQVATSVVNGVMDVLGGIVSGAFSLISAPFKLFGGKGNSIRDKVTITGGVIDTVKEVEHVKEIEHVTNVDKVSAVSKVDELGFGKVVTITPETGAAGLAAGAKKLKHFSKFGSGLKAAGSKFKSAFDLQLFGGGAVNQQAPVGENVSADMLASGVSGVSVFK